MQYCVMNNLELRFSATSSQHTCYVVARIPATMTIQRGRSLQFFAIYNPTLLSDGGQPSLPIAKIAYCAAIPNSPSVSG